ncbi:MAG: hypothetical protein RLY93_12705 [Sumerlaeia bacterium]
MRPSGFLFLAFCLMAVALTSGCARKMPATDGLVTMAVLDARVENGETRKSTAGWWLSARDRYDSGNAGVLAGEALAREFGRIPGVQVYSRTDLTAFMASKERVLNQIYPGLTPEERLVVLQMQDPLDYGRALNVDYVLSSQVGESRTVHDKTLHTWKSEADLELSLVEVQSGDEVWRWSGQDTDWFTSQLGVLEDLARKARRDLSGQLILEPNRP